MLLSCLLLIAGCTRPHYRRQADAEVNSILDDKAAAACLVPGQFRIDVDPRSRMFDPYNPDCPPMPPDDPVSHQLMLCVDCKPGSPCWHHMGKTPYTDNPQWEDFLPRDEEGQIVLDLPAAVQLAFLHSTDYQAQLETLYLSGLDVTFERFRFDTQFFGNSSIFFTADGRERTGTGRSSSLLEVQPFNMEARRLTATGGELVVGFANTLIWQFAGPDDYTSNTILDFTFLQPLLRAGGRIRVLERLTLAERALLANVRQMERYRSGFYLNVVTGRDTGPGPSRRGGFFGGTGLEGFAGVGGGGFGRAGGVGAQFVPGVGQVGAVGAGGYLGLLQTAQVIRNQHANIAGLRDSFEHLNAAHEAGRIDRFQVDLARQALYNAQSELLIALAQYETNLDLFKVQHGLPPDVPIQIEDELLERFNLLHPELANVQMRVSDVLTVLREGPHVAEIEANRIRLLPAPLREEAERSLTAQELAMLAAQSADLRDEAARQLQIAQADFQELQGALPRRRATLQQLAQREEVQTLELDPDLLSPDALDERFNVLARDLGLSEQRLRVVLGRLDMVTRDAVLPPEQIRAQLAAAMTDLSAELLELSLLQARARLDAITFDPIDLSSEDAFCIASRHRLDWMNARAAVVDSWRLVHFNANDLQSDLDLVFSGDIGNVGDNPFRLRGTRGRLRVGLQFDAPLTRLAERNTYRQSLIEYQQSKRTYYRFRDNVHRGIRATLRQLRVDELNFELRRAAVHVAITQVDIARLRLVEPARPVAPVAPGQPVLLVDPFGATIARDLVTAQIELLRVQNDFLSVWVDHYVQRLQLEFDLGIIQLDPRGLRIELSQPLRAFLETLPHGNVPCELPDPCGKAGCVCCGAVDLRQPEGGPGLDFSPLGPPENDEELPLLPPPTGNAVRPSPMVRAGG